MPESEQKESEGVLAAISRAIAPFLPGKKPAKPNERKTTPLGKGIAEKGRQSVISGATRSERELERMGE
jgi:hypothetical protein